MFKLLGGALIIVIPVLAALGFAATIVVHMYNLTLLSIYLVVPMLLAAPLYLLFCRNPRCETARYASPGISDQTAGQRRG